MSLLLEILNGLSFWAMGMVYVIPQKPQKHFLLRVSICAGGLMLFGAVFHFLHMETPRLQYVRELIYAALLIGMLFYCNKIHFKTAVYYGSWVLMLRHFIVETGQLLYFGLVKYQVLEPGRMNEGLFMTGYYIICLTFNALTIAKWMSEQGHYNIGPKQMVSELFIFAIFELLYVNLSTGGPIIYKSNWNMVILVQFLCILILYLQNEIFKKSAMRQEMVTMNLLWQRQKEQYSLARENITLINRKCHDLKHQIRALRNIAGEQEREAYLQEVEDSIKIYEAIVHTGNEVLDTILTDKSLYCKDKGILISCVADGSQMSFIQTIDLYTILGNALDNAIEGVQQIVEQEKRQIDVLIYREQSFLVINIINPLQRKLHFVDNLPVTTKGNTGYHGFGLKSIRHMVKKYDGFVKIAVEDDCFDLKILIPIPATEERSITYKP